MLDGRHERTPGGPWGGGGSGSCGCRKGGGGRGAGESAPGAGVKREGPSQAVRGRGGAVWEKGRS
ncbi:hypothetical protein SBD_7388 [Streptomyces bottropensis ATCC 25435]|uniref:Uncharacterized protein n=1 Tax=Streptomyces bottropensis ATCC 25435 TaxID=1054862 RepID=M3FI56_9ACTN|nr:hypothetical protein SBD_7388 [Streptomyces bottropensis ATCC 25435]